jgi:hypothetical protein
MTDTTIKKGFLKRPLPIVIINLWLFLSPLGYLGLLLSYIGSTTGASYGFMFYEYIVVLIVLPLVVGTALRRMNFIAWWLVVFYSVVLILHNIASIFIYKIDSYRTIVPVFIAFQLACIGIIIYFVVIHKQFREIFFDRRLRWWESLSRFKIDAPAYLTLTDGSNRMLDIDDVGRGGICLYIKDTQVNPEEINRLKFDFFETTFKSEVKCIWSRDDRAGLEFVNMDRENRKILKGIIRMIKKVGKVGPEYLEEHHKKELRP